MARSPSSLGELVTAAGATDDHPAVPAAGGGLVQKVNHMPGIFFLAVKSSFCNELMERRRALPWCRPPLCLAWRSARCRLSVSAIRWPQV